MPAYLAKVHQMLGGGGYLARSSELQTWEVSKMKPESAAIGVIISQKSTCLFAG